MGGHVVPTWVPKFADNTLPPPPIPAPSPMKGGQPKANLNIHEMGRFDHFGLKLNMLNCTVFYWSQTSSSCCLCITCTGRVIQWSRWRMDNNKP